MKIQNSIFRGIIKFSLAYFHIVVSMSYDDILYFVLKHIFFHHTKKSSYDVNILKIEILNEFRLLQ